jgi:hypothetical protein
MDWIYVVAGAFVGLVVGLTGVGGGALMTPLLVLLFGISPAVAVGTDLLYAAITKSAGVVVHSLKGSVQWRIVGQLAAGSLPGAVVGVVWLKEYAARGGDFNALIMPALSGVLVLTALVLLFKERWQRALDRRLGESREHLRRWRTPATVAAGFVLGVMVALTSIGAGALGAAVLCLLYPRLPAIAVVGTDLAHAVPLALVAGLGHLHLGTVDFALLGSLLLGSVPGIVIGSHLGLRLPERVLRPILATLLIIIGLRFAF